MVKTSLIFCTRNFSEGLKCIFSWTQKLNPNLDLKLMANGKTSSYLCRVTFLLFYIFNCN